MSTADRDDLRTSNTEAELADLAAAAAHVRQLPAGHTDEWGPREHLGHHVIFAVMDREIDRLKADAADLRAAVLVKCDNLEQEAREVRGTTHYNAYVDQTITSIVKSFRAVLDDPADVLAEHDRKIAEAAFDACADQFGGSVWDAPYIKANNPHRKTQQREDRI